MAPTVKTRAVSGEKYGGSEQLLPEVDLPTGSDIARFFYHVCLTESDYNTQVRLVAEKVISVWGNCNPRLPLKSSKQIWNKLKAFLDLVKSFNWDRLTASRRKLLNEKKDKLFDVAACLCELPIVTCDNERVKCSAENCERTHIVCECPVGMKIPIEEREYLRDQRSKVGTKGQFQMRGRVLQAAADRRVRHGARRSEDLTQIVVHPVFEVNTSTGTYLLFLRIY
jgi:hypothetical protein